MQIKSSMSIHMKYMLFYSFYTLDTINHTRPMPQYSFKWYKEQHTQMIEEKWHAHNAQVHDRFYVV